MNRILIAACLMSSMAFAADKTGPARWSGGGDSEARAAKQEEQARKGRMMAVVGIAEALELNEADALKLSEKLKVIDEKRKPIRDSMSDAMKSIKAGAEGDSAALAKVDQDVARLLDGRAQMAELDKEMFTQLSVGQTPQKKAKLALFLAKFGEEMRRMKAAKGRHLALR